MTAADTAALHQATARVKAMRQRGLSEATIADAVGVHRFAIRTILSAGATNTRGKNKRHLIAWIANTGGVGEPTAGPAGARRRYRRRSSGAGVAAPAGTSITLELSSGQILRLTTGSHYLLDNGRLLRRL
jgi:hypothetical protein